MKINAQRIENAEDTQVWVHQADAVDIPDDARHPDEGVSVDREHPETTSLNISIGMTANALGNPVRVGTRIVGHLTSIAGSWWIRITKESKLDTKWIEPRREMIIPVSTMEEVRAVGLGLWAAGVFIYEGVE